MHDWELQAHFLTEGFKEWILPIFYTTIEWLKEAGPKLGTFLGHSRSEPALMWHAWELEVHFLITGYKEWILPVLHAANKPLQKNPYAALFIAFLIFLGPWILLVPLFLLQSFVFIVLHALGFGISGITGGSPAALYQSFCFGGHTPANSVFAMLQSMGTYYNVGTVSNMVLVVIRLVAGAIGLYVLFGIILV
ncbi:hypothetical protein DXG03_004631 [Asterophora parasitica]|uniref:Uncharacterized protein n=1 Tax=Asterophora parasitica TaxID=117018 RepID=A0A9P7G8V1_9AGAR|nr:hypothetical protein DXG03_004631 [Asterophora parasitica]